MTGAALNDLRESAGISLAELARELKVTRPSVRDTFESMRLRPSTEERYVSAVSRIIRAKAAERERLRTEALLADLTT